MAWAVPEYSVQQVNRAGRIVAGAYGTDGSGWSDDQWNVYWNATWTIDNWRAAHGFPLNTFQMNLRNAASRFDPDFIVAQRTKRLVSIAKKLVDRPLMKLSQMQDIGGCRVVVSSIKSVIELDNFYSSKTTMKHELSGVDDYIGVPKPSGYRGIHRKYKYRSDRLAPSIYNGLKIEMQIRTLYQHAWATAVETVGMFIGQALKSSIGEHEWLRFFSLMGSVVAHEEGTPCVPGTPEDVRELCDELEVHERRLNVTNRLMAYQNALREIRAPDGQNAHYYLLQLNPSREVPSLSITGFKKNQLAEASAQYAEAEKVVREQPDRDAVLVSVDSVAALERAYPNYFADTRLFQQLMARALAGR